MANLMPPTCGSTGGSAMLRSMADTSVAVACVIASRDRPEHLAVALESVLQARRPGDEVVVVDSASRDDATLAVAEAAGVRCVRCELPGVARARNAGFSATTAPVVAFTDD